MLPGEVMTARVNPLLLPCFRIRVDALALGAGGDPSSPSAALQDGLSRHAQKAAHLFQEHQGLRADEVHDSAPRYRSSTMASRACPVPQLRVPLKRNSAPRASLMVILAREPEAGEHRQQGGIRSRHLASRRRQLTSLAFSPSCVRPSMEKLGVPRTPAAEAN